MKIHLATDHAGLDLKNDGPADIHSVENITGEFATSLHVYAKPYDACDIYDIEKGTVDRIKLSYHSIDGILC